MTIIQPSRYREIIRFLIFFFTVLLVGGALAIFEYSKIADLRYELKNLKSNLVILEIESAELKNQFYASIATERLEALAREQGLIIDKNPDYMSSNQWLSVSSY